MIDQMMRPVIRQMIPQGHKAEILLEDNLGDELLALRAFKNSRIANNFTCAGSAEEALTMLGQEGAYAGHRLPDVIIIDLNLPKMSGRRFLSLVKDNIGLKHIPVIVMTSSEAAIDVRSCQDLHACAYIVKPQHLDAFRGVVARIEELCFESADIPVSGQRPLRLQ